MTTQEDIQKQLDSEIAKFQESIFDGHVPVFVPDLFTKAMMANPISKHGYTMSFVKNFSKKESHQLTVLEVGFAINLIFQTNWCDLYDSFEEAVRKNEELEKTKDDYNKVSADFEKRMIKKRQTLMNLSGISRQPIMPVIGKA